MREETEVCLRCRKLLVQHKGGQTRRLGTGEFISPFSRKRLIGRKSSQAFPRKVCRRDKMHFYFVRAMRLPTVSTAWLLPYKISFAEHPKLQRQGDYTKLEIKLKNSKPLLQERGGTWQ